MESDSERGGYNFFHEYSVTLVHPIDEVFNVVGVGENMERVVRLSGLCSGFELGDRDFVEIPNDAPLAQSSARTLPAAQPDGTHALPRRAFRLEEAIPLLFGLITKKIVILGTQTWDGDAKVTLYESVTDAGVQVWKLRRFEEVDDAGTKTTRITETIKGKAPALLRSIVQKETARSHKAHMDLYHTLFAH